MSKERVEAIAILIVIALLMSFFALLDAGLNPVPPTGHSIFNPQEKRDVDFILTAIKKNPSSFMVVYGRDAEGYEIEYAGKIADHFGIITKNELYVSSRKNMILAGNPASNLLLNKFFFEKYSAKNPRITSSRGNLVLVFSNEKQAADIVKQIIGKIKETPTEPSPEIERLSPIRLGILDYLDLPSLIILIIGIAAIFLLFAESHRHVGIREARETKDEHKVAAIEKYIERYEEQGHPEEQIKEWLEKYGYPAELIEIALHTVHGTKPEEAERPKEEPEEEIPKPIKESEEEAPVEKGKKKAEEESKEEEEEIPSPIKKGKKEEEEIPSPIKKTKKED
jgi:hypothetical protein